MEFNTKHVQSECKAQSVLPYNTNLEHLRHELDRLDGLLGRAVEQFQERRDQGQPAEFHGLHISDWEIVSLLSKEDQSLNQTWVKAQAKVLDLHRDIQQRVAETQVTDVVLRLPYLKKVFNLSLFEIDLLLLTLASELELRYQKLYAYLQDDVTRIRPSIELALRLFCSSLEEQVKAREAFNNNSPLLQHRLLLLHEDANDRPSPLLSHSLKLDDRITEFLLGHDRPDASLLYPVPLIEAILPKQQFKDLVLPETVQRSLQQISTLDTRSTSWFCLLLGTDETEKLRCAEAVAQAKGRSLLVLKLAAMLQAELPFQTLIQLAFREAWLYRSIIYLQDWQDLFADEPKHRSAIRLIEQAIAQFHELVFADATSSWQPKPDAAYRFIQLELPLPNDRMRQRLWQTYLQQSKHVSSDLNPGYLASAFRFSSAQIQQAIAHAEAHARLSQGVDYTLTLPDLLDGCQLTSSQHLVSFARKISPKRTWQDLVLPKDTLAQLQELCQQVRHRTQVYTDWGFDQQLSLGKGVIALFTGDSGTGKTLSAEILAKELGLNLYQVDLSLVVSKYIGETEKNLSRVFSEAQASNAILFFDEADALFGKRSEIKDAHDRYANIEINYLLQQVEAYEGIIILTSNLSKNIDSAFIRRLHFSVEFPFPNEANRLQIWRKMFPPQAPLSDDIDFEFLAAKFKIAGGNIKNAALTAAFRAAEEGNSIRMKHLILSMKREYQKLGKICEKTEFEPYYELVR
jgi:hypothetical protein